MLLLTFVDVERWRVDGKVQLVEHLGDVGEVEALVAFCFGIEVGQLRTARDGSQSFWEVADVLGVVILHDMAAASGDGDVIQQFEEVEAEFFLQSLGGTFLVRQLCPAVVCLLGVLEYLIDVFAFAQEVVELVGSSLVRKLQLVLEVIESIVDWGGGEHQDLGGGAASDDAVHQSLVAILLASFRLHSVDAIVVLSFFIEVFVNVASIAEVMALVYHQEIIVAPVHSLQVHTVGLALVSRQVGMEENIIVEAVGSYRVVDIIRFITNPVIVQFLRA